MQGLARRLRALSENVRSLALMDVYGRVARLLLDLAVDQEGNRVIEEKLTQNDIAARIGASSKMVGRIMQDLKKGGYVRKKDKQLIIARPLPPAW
jgi:CRP/FNR family cyclic AMP-dependent transcriptional regulator